MHLPATDGSPKLGSVTMAGTQVSRDTDVEVRVLGPVTVVRGDTVRTPTASKQRALLAALACRSNRVVPVEEIEDALWDTAPPPSARAALHGYVSALRRRIGPAAGPGGQLVLETRPGGYVLHLPPDRLDLARFRAFSARGHDRLRRRECRAAAGLFQEALRCWTGGALADVRAGGMLGHYAARLDEDRLSVLEERIQAELCLGVGPRLVGELTELCGRHPLRERPHRQLMTALQSGGRPAEALQVFTRLRRRTVDELGIEPGMELRHLQREILAGAGERHQDHTCCPPGTPADRDEMLPSRLGARPGP